MEHYIETLLHMDEVCETFRKHTINKIFKRKSHTSTRGLILYCPVYQTADFKAMKGVVRTIELFGIDALEHKVHALTTIINKLEDRNVVKAEKRFYLWMDKLLEFFSNESVKKQIEDRLSILDSEERRRLNEAIHCFLEDCNYSSVAMSVSAIEFRLLSLMKSVQPDQKLENMTLGQLINEYLSNKDKYGRVIPKKYEPLLEHCNTYRIFSVHPKKEKISKSIATSIIHMTFQFLLDKKLARKTVT